MDEFLKANKERRLKVVVVGDCMIDDYKYGKVKRVSPEFPVQILHSRKREVQQYPGGAANVCHQLAHFNADTYLVGFIDDDAKKLYSKYYFNTEYCVPLTDGFVPVKTRFYDDDFALLRWDIEDENYGDSQIEELRKLALAKFTKLVNDIKPDVIIFSDYNKGFWNAETTYKYLRACEGIKTLVDPKSDFGQWEGCTVIKPNMLEAESITGTKNWKEQVKIIESLLPGTQIVITQSGAGVVGKANNEYFQHKANGLSDKEVNSVIGAGDCFIGVLALTLAHDLPIEEGCKIAFEAGVHYVKARHNKPVTIHDIHARFDHVKAKIMDWQDLKHVKDLNSDLTWVFTNGCFDGGLHSGHLDTLRFAKSKGDKLIVAINSDDSIKELKGEDRPICSQDDRAYALASLECVDYVAMFGWPTPKEPIRYIEPDYLVKGGDYKKEDVVGWEFVKEVFIAPTREGYSTTSFLKKVVEKSK